MNLLKEVRLPFGKIADQWARELEEAKTPGRLNRDEILQKLLNAVRRGLFNNALLTIEVAPRYDKDGQRSNLSRIRVTQETLATMLLLRSGVGQIDPHSELKLSDYEPLSLRTWIEPLTISREDFDQWCNDYRLTRPAFWFAGRGKHVVAASQSHTETAQLRGKLQRWLEEETAKPEAQSLVKEDFLKRAREKVDKHITENLFHEVWRIANLAERFRKKGRRLGRN